MLLLTLALTFLLLPDRSNEQVSKKGFLKLRQKFTRFLESLFLRKFWVEPVFLIVSSRKVLSSWLSYFYLYWVHYKCKRTEQGNLLHGTLSH